MRKPILCYVTDRRALEPAPEHSEPAAGESHPDIAPALYDSIRRAIASGVDWIQIREKDLVGRSVLQLAQFAVSEARTTHTKVFINDRLDVAIAAIAAGVHLGENSLPAENVIEWRRSGGRADFLVGVSCHSLEAARVAERGGADYVFFGPVFATPSKMAFGAPQGIERLREVCGAIGIPVLAIGGVGSENARACFEAGAAGIAAIRLFQDAGRAEELDALVRTLR